MLKYPLMNILSIESSCDETAAAVIKNGQEILSNVVVSQIDIHSAYGGVVPEIAARSHIEVILPVVHQALQDAKVNWDNINAIAVTHTPGLLGSLLVGTLTARTLAIIQQKPLYAIHHLKSHIYANWLNSPITPTFPLIALVVSGGHTQLVAMDHHNDFNIIGSTRDDAVGEVFDKVAKILGLPYPGGPAIAKAALQGDPHRYPLPIPKLPNLEFSFSGLKTAVLRSVQDTLQVSIETPSSQLASQLSTQQVQDYAASFQYTVIKILIQKLRAAINQYPAKSIILAGGVSANQALRDAVQQNFATDFALHFPAPQFSTDNAAMVGAAAYFSIISGQAPSDPYTLDIAPRSPLS